jgi:hypothetical protein
MEQNPTPQIRARINRRIDDFLALCDEVLTEQTEEVAR